MCQLTLLTLASLVLAFQMSVHGAAEDMKFHDVEYTSDFQQFATKTKALTGDIMNVWGPVQSSYNKLITEYVRDTFGRGSMNMFVVLHSEQDFHTITQGFIASNPECNVTLEDLTLTSIPIMEKLTVNVVLDEMFLNASAELERVIIQGRYSLYRPKGVIDHSASGVHSPFSYQEVLDDGELVIIGHNCKFEGGGTLTMVGHTLSMENPNFLIKDCYYELEISTPYTGTGPVFSPYFDHEQKKHLNLLLSQPIRKTFVMRVNNALYSSVNVTSIVGAELAKQMRALCSLSTSITRTIFARMHRRLNAILVSEGKASVDLSDFTNMFNSIKPDGLRGTLLTLKNVQLNGLDSSMSAGAGAAHVCKSHSGEIRFSEMSSFRRLQVTLAGLTVSGSYSYIQAGSELILSTGTFSALARNVRLSCDLGAELTSRRSDQTGLTWLMRELTLLGWNHLEMSVFGSADPKIKNRIKASLAGYCNKALTVVIEEFHKRAIPVVLKNLDKQDSGQIRRRHSKQERRKSVLVTRSDNQTERKNH